MLSSYDSPLYIRQYVFWVGALVTSLLSTLHQCYRWRCWLRALLRKGRKGWFDPENMETIHEVVNSFSCRKYFPYCSRSVVEKWTLPVWEDKNISSLIFFSYRRGCSSRPYSVNDRQEPVADVLLVLLRTTPSCFCSNDWINYLLFSSLSRWLWWVMIVIFSRSHWDDFCGVEKWHGQPLSTSNLFSHR